jgi:membrane-bound ClpP family serine protease
MADRFRCALLLAAVFLATAVLTLPADAAVYKNKVTGETLRGTLTPQRINNTNIFKMDDGRTKYVNPDDWELVEGDKPAAATPAAAPAPGAAPQPTAAVPSTEAARPGAPAKAPAEPVAYVFPISGPINSHALVEALDTGLAEAKKLNAEVVILRMNTPGGRLDLSESIIKALEKIEGATLVSFVSGEDRRALSAGAYICMATQKIFMAPGCTLGAATPYTRNTMTGSAEIDEKMISAFRARFRSLAQMRGHPVALADAMVDRTTSVIQVFVDNSPTLVTDEDAKLLETEHKSDGRFKRGKTVNKPGKLITLTSDEALEFKVCAAIVANEKELLAQMGKGNLQVVEAKWAPAWIEKVSKERKKKYDDLDALFHLHIEQALAFDPQNNYLTPGSAQWKTATDRAMGHLKECAKAVTELEKMAKDERYDLAYSGESIRKMKTELDSVYRRLGAQRNF